MSDQCVHGDDGKCKTHAPGTDGEAEKSNQVLEIASELIKRSVQPLLNAWSDLRMAAAIIEQANKELAEAGKETFSQTEQVAADQVQTVLDAAVAAVKALEAARVLSPNAS